MAYDHVFVKRVLLNSMVFFFYLKSTVVRGQFALIHGLYSSDGSRKTQPEAFYFSMTRAFHKVDHQLLLASYI